MPQVKVKECYINDSGNQIVSFTARSIPVTSSALVSIRKCLPRVISLLCHRPCQGLIDEHGDEFLKMPRDEAESKLGKLGLKML